LARNPQLQDLCGLGGLELVDGRLVIEQRAGSRNGARFHRLDGATQTKLAANGTAAFTPVSQCAWRGDGVCDESRVFAGDVLEECSATPCCQLGGPTGICQDGRTYPRIGRCPAASRRKRK
jgi:hypothetical protein